MSHDAESKKQQEMLQGGQATFSHLSPIPGGIEQVLSLAVAANPVFFNQPVGSPFPGGTNPVAVAVGDFNGNSFLDIVIANQDANNVSVLLNNGDGTFAAAQNFSVGSDPVAVAVGDFNGDGKLDIVTTSYDSNYVSVLLNSSAPGSATLSFAPHQDFSVGAGSNGVAVGDLNGDGKLDIVATNPNSNTVAVLLNTTALASAIASFAPAHTFTVGTFGVGPFGLAVGDFNEDGKPDIVTANFDSNTISVLLNTTVPGGLTPSFAPAHTFNVGSEPDAVAVGDLNGEGKLDIVTANFDGRNVSVLLNTTSPGSLTPSFATARNFNIGSEPIGVALGDFNGDGKLDIVAANSGNNTVSVLLNTTPAGSAIASFATHQDFSVGTSPFGVVVGDFNRDGKLDIVTANSNSNDVTVLLQSPLVVNVEIIHVIQNVSFTGSIAIITRASMVSDTHVAIDWGDGSPLDTTGTVSQNLDGSLTVSGSHTYAQTGNFPLTVTATEGIFTSQGMGQAILKTTSLLHARAFGVQSSKPAQGPFGAVSLPQTGGKQAATVPSALLPGLVVSGITDAVSGALTPPPLHADASSMIASLVGQGIVASGINVIAHSDLSSPAGVVAGTMTFAYLIANGSIYPADFAPAPNTVVSMPGLGTLTLNEQAVTRNTNGVLIVVNALHLHITQGPQAGADIVIGHVEAGITLS